MPGRVHVLRPQVRDVVYVLLGFSFTKLERPNKFYAICKKKLFTPHNDL